MACDVSTAVRFVLLLTFCILVYFCYFANAFYKKIFDYILICPKKAPIKIGAFGSLEFVASTN